MAMTASVQLLLRERLKLYLNFFRLQLNLSLYTLNLEVLSRLVDEAHHRYLEGRRPHVIVHLNDTNVGALWNNVKRKNRRPLDSIILPEGVLDSLVEDVQDFMRTEDWYIQAGIPYRRGYLLYGPPGTGKTSTIYALAGELGLEIYALSLSSGCVDDVMLEKSLSSLPKNSIFLLEDIDCAFLSREEDEEDIKTTSWPSRNSRGLQVTMSGLLNVLDGVASEDGKIFFATTNYMDRLDPALIRPGRIDKKIEYKLATKSQARALFKRFYPPDQGGEKRIDKLQEYGAAFAAQIPEDEFTTAELQGYLLPHKKNPGDAVQYIPEWIENERAERKRRREVEQRMREKAMQRAQRAATAVVHGTFSKVS
ncbi:hypothetical protein AX15_005928 [Amanita polypyramis BW_CC]|nr:hypothetical protein AX15_005928 [Amanita polypyramis BW_CC]